MQQHAIQVINVNETSSQRFNVYQWRVVEDPAEEESVCMPVIRRRAAWRRKRSTTTHVDRAALIPLDARPGAALRDPRCQLKQFSHIRVDVVLQRPPFAQTVVWAPEDLIPMPEPKQKNGVTKPLKKKRKVAVKPAQPLPQVAPSPVPEPAHVDDPQIMDIDEGESDMPELCSEYVKDIYAYLMDLEVRHAVRPDYMKGYDITAITPLMRARLIDWLINVHSVLSLRQETLYLTVAILDRFLQVQPVSATILQLVGVTAMLLASKYESLKRGAPKVWHFARLTDDACTPTQIRSMEQVILKALNFELGSPLPLHFLKRASKAATASMKIYALAKYLMELTLLDYKMVHYRPSEISAASLCLSQSLLDGTPWTPTEKYYTTYDEAHLQPIMHQMVKNVIVANDERTEFQAVRSKYSQSRQMEIALLPELQSSVLKSLAAPLLDTVYEVDSLDCDYDKEASLSWLKFLRS